MSKKRLTITILVLFLIASAILILLIPIADKLNIPYSSFTKDPNTIIRVGKGKFYFGFISNLGVILWCSSFVLMTMSAIFTYKISKTNFGFYLSLTILNLVLLFDDLFMIHERAFPYLTGLSERYLILSYALFLSSVLYIYRSLILRSSFILLILSFFFFGLSLFFDFYQSEDVLYHYLYEDGFKFIGIIFWAFYHFELGYKLFIESNTDLSN